MDGVAHSGAQRTDFISCVVMKPGRMLGALAVTVVSRFMKNFFSRSPLQLLQKGRLP